MFDPNELLPDIALTQYTPLDVAGFLRQRNSPLLAVVTPEGSAAELLDRVAREVGLDPRVLLVKLQVEQSLLTQPATSERLDWAFGYGVPDDGPRDERFRGFARQLRAAASTLRAYLQPDHPFTVVDLVGKPLQVSDGTVVPRNLATAALYRYTPWIGNAASHGLEPPFGNYLFYLVWTELFGDPLGAPEDLGWRVIAPADRWRDPLRVSPEVVSTLQEVAGRLGLRTTLDSTRRKLFLSLPRPQQGPSPRPEESGADLTYPSGYRARLAPRLSGAEAARYAPAGTGPPAPLVEAEPAARLSEHFTMGEFLPHDPQYRYVRVAPGLVALLEELRHQLGDVPLHITSSYRPPAYNAAIGGASQSVHMDGLAADVYADVAFAKLAAAAERVVGERGGLGLYPADGFVHVDLRGTRARWP